MKPSIVTHPFFLPIINWRTLMTRSTKSVSTIRRHASHWPIAAIQSLRRLRPDSGETHLALAKHLYLGYLDYDRARQELTVAQRMLPNDTDVLSAAGYIDRRQGRWDDSMRNLERASELDPRNVLILEQLAFNYELLRRYD